MRRCTAPHRPFSTSLTAAEAQHFVSRLRLTSQQPETRRREGVDAAARSLEAAAFEGRAGAFGALASHRAQLGDIDGAGLVIDWCVVVVFLVFLERGFGVLLAGRRGCSLRAEASVRIGDALGPLPPRLPAASLACAVDGAGDKQPPAAPLWSRVLEHRPPGEPAAALKQAALECAAGAPVGALLRWIRALFVPGLGPGAGALAEIWDRLEIRKAA